MEVVIYGRSIDFISLQRSETWSTLIKKKKRKYKMEVVDKGKQVIYATRCFIHDMQIVLLFMLYFTKSNIYLQDIRETCSKSRVNFPMACLACDSHGDFYVTYVKDFKMVISI